jgi:acetate kinase
MKVMPGKKNVAVFDTAFHQTIPEERYIYPIPYKYYEKYGVRKYGFHGTSHRYVSARVAELANKPVDNLKTIVCHLGQGASLCAVKGGKSLDTSMGLTPLAGIPMGTRCGDIDPSIVTYLMDKENLSTEEVNKILNKESGVYGVSGVTPDFRDIEAKVAEGDERASIAIKNYNYTVAQYIAKYAVTMGGMDAIVFTAGVGENQINIRKGICEHLEFMGVKLDLDKNNVRSEEREISSDDSKVKVFIIPTDEEMVIARDTMALIK